MPNIPEDAGPGPTVVVQLDLNASPPVAPIPNDLALSPTTGLITFPAPSQTQTAAQTEFNNSYLATLAGFPFESSLQVQVSGALDPASVTPQSVVVVDVTQASQDPTKAIVPGLQPVFDPSGGAIDLANPSGWSRAHRYAVVLVAADATHAGLRGAHGEPVIGSPTWGLLSSPSPLVSCPANDLTSASCTLAVDVIPSTETDPTLRLIDQLQKAKELEPIRESYATLFSSVLSPLLQIPLSRIPIFWTFTIVDAGEVTFDPANQIVPFPNDVLRSPTTGNVSLPNPLTGAPLTAADCAAPANSSVALYCGLDTLDGFSTIAAPVSQNGLTADAVAQASIDPASLVPATPPSVGLVPIHSTAPVGEQTPGPQYTPCLNCMSSPASDGTPQTSPQALQWQLNAPLDELTTYLAYVTNAVTDTRGKPVVANPVFALLRLTHPLVDANGSSQVDILSDAQAAQLEPLRLALKPALDGIVATGVQRPSIVLAWTFTTQSEATDLDGLHAAVMAPPSAQTLQGVLPQGPLYFTDDTATYENAAAALGIQVTAIGKIYSGAFVTPYMVTGPGGTLNPAAPVPEVVPFEMAVPATPALSTGYPIAIFGHGITRDRNDFIAIANALAKAGEVTIATDAPLHGDRSTCTGAGPFIAAALGMTTASDDDACESPATMKCNEDPLIGRCVARDPSTRIACQGPAIAAGPDPTGNLVCREAAARQGLCASDGFCEGGDFLREEDVPSDVYSDPRPSPDRPLISGWNIFSLTNFFATRDNFRQQVVDLAELVHLLNVVGPTSIASAVAAAGGPAISLDLAHLGYVGQSLGGILGTLFNAVSPDTNNVVLNVAGGDLPSIILQAPNFASDRAALLAGLAAQGIQPGTPAFDRFIATAQWILDPADPANLAWRLTHGITLTAPDGTMIKSPNFNRKALIQFVQGDQTVPNVSNFALLEAAERPTLPLGTNTNFVPPRFGCEPPLYCYEFTAADGLVATTPPVDPHSFLLVPPVSQDKPVTAVAQGQVADFLSAGVAP